MAGKPKNGIDYAGWSVYIFDNDTKIDKLLDAHGWKGFGVYFFLCMRAFAGEGYFYKWGFDDCASTAKKMGGGIGSGTIQEVVGYCLQIGLFHKGLFEEWGVLTSRGIQRSYWAVLKTRRSRMVFKELWLLYDSECEGLVFVPLNENMSDVNSHLQSANKDMSVTNECVVKESKVKESNKNIMGRFTPPSVDEVRSYCLERNNGIDAQSFVDFYESKGWMIGKNRMKDWKASVRTWERNRRQQSGGARSVSGKTKNSFNSFPQNNYDFDALEKALLEEERHE